MKRKVVYVCSPLKGNYEKNIVKANLYCRYAYEKGCILNSRILWFFSTCAFVLKDSKYIGYADHAYAFLQDAFSDQENGGLFWSASYDGSPKDTTKHTYCQAFGIYALTAYYRASGNKNALKLASDLVDIIESRCRDERGYLEAFNADFSPASNEKLSENGVLAARTMNTLLHVFEAYTLFYEVTKRADIAALLREMLLLFKDRMYSPSKHRLEVFFDNNYHSLIDLISYGHDIEASWLIDLGLEVLGDDEMTAALSPLTADLADNILHTAFDGHSLPQECEAGKVLEAREWWVQAETVNGFLNAYLKDPTKKEYKDALLSQWSYIKDHVICDRAGAEWYTTLDKDGNPDLTKPFVQPWKCPYHNGRMCLEVIRRDVKF